MYGLFLVYRFRTLKGRLARDFLVQVFFHESVSLGSLSIPLGPLRIFTQICRDIHNFVLIAGVNDTGDEAVATMSAFLHLHEEKNHNMSVKSNQAASKVNMKTKFCLTYFLIVDAGD